MRRPVNEVFTTVYAVLLISLLAGCGTFSRGHVRGQVEVPAEAPTANVRTDTLHVDAPELEPAGRATLPTRLEFFDTLRAPAAPVVAVDVDHEHVTVTTPTSRHTYRTPAYGEELHVQAGSTGISAAVRGEPTRRRIEAHVEQEKRSVWAKLADLPGIVLAAIALLLLAIVYKIVSR